MEHTCLHTPLHACAPPQLHTSHLYAHTQAHSPAHTPRTSPLPHSLGHTETHTHLGVLTLAPLFSGAAVGSPAHAVHACTVPAAWNSHAVPGHRSVGSRTALRQVHAKRALPPRWCQRRCPHSAAAASHSGSGSERAGCEGAADGGDGRALGARWHSRHDPGRLPAHPTSAGRINEHGPALRPTGLLIRLTCRQ